MALSIDDLLPSKELKQLERRYGLFDRQHFTISCSRQTRKFRARRAETRRGESLFLLQRGDGRVLLHTKRSYPRQAYRLPTGGIDWGEPVVESMRREVREETGFTIEREQMLALLTYSFEEGNRSAPFVTYVFLIDGVEGEPRPQDESEGISGFQWRHPHDLQQVVETLQGLECQGTGRDDWGRFRAAAHRYVMSLDWAGLAPGATAGLPGGALPAR